VRERVNPTRPRQEHNDDIRLALIAAAEELLAEEGPEGLSVRAVAARVGTTTQAVYTLFGAKDGLINALAVRLYEMIGAAIVDAPCTEDPGADLVEAAVLLRNVVQSHPSLYRVAFQRVVPGVGPTHELNAARLKALGSFHSRFDRMVEAGMLASGDLEPAMLQFSALIEGLANTELRGDALRLLPFDGQEQSWRSAVDTIVSGWAARQRAASN
jgi:AcrR family transcriptional regulator